MVSIIQRIYTYVKDLPDHEELETASARRYYVPWAAHEGFRHSNIGCFRSAEFCAERTFWAKSYCLKCGNPQSDVAGEL